MLDDSKGNLIVKIKLQSKSQLNIEISGYIQYISNQPIIMHLKTACNISQ